MRWRRVRRDDARPNDKEMITIEDAIAAAQWPASNIRVF